MSDEETRQLSKDLESLQETLEAGTPAQIPLLDDVVDEEELRRHAPVAPPRRKRTSRNSHEMKLQPPETGDLFDPAEPESDNDRQPAVDESPSLAAEPDETVPREDSGEQVEPVRYAKPRPDGDETGPDTRDMLKVRADRMVEDLVAEYSSEIIGRLKSELTERLYAILEDLNIDHDDDSRSS